MVSRPAVVCEMGATRLHLNYKKNLITQHSCVKKKLSFRRHPRQLSTVQGREEHKNLTVVQDTSNFTLDS